MLVKININLEEKRKISGNNDVEMNLKSEKEKFVFYFQIFVI